MPLSNEDINFLSGPRETDDSVPTPVDPTNPAQLSVSQASYEDPDVYAEDLEIGNEAGLTVDVVRQDKPEVERQNKLNKMDMRALLGDSPKLNTWLENQDNAKLSSDDIPHLANIETENNKRPWYDLSISDFDGLASSMAVGMTKTYDAAMLGFYSQAQDMDMSIIDKYRREGNDRLADEMMRVRGERIDKRQLEINKHMASLGVAEDEIARMTPKDLTIMAQGFRGGAQMFADFMPGAAVSIVTGGRVNPTLALLTTKAGLESYGSARLEGKEHDQALIYGSVDAFLELITEKVPTKYAEELYKKIGKGDMAETAGKFIIGDLAGEQVATFTQTLNAVAHGLDEELANADSIGEMLKIQGERQLVTAIATITGGGGIAGVPYAADRWATRDQRRNQILLKKLHGRVQSEQADEWLENQIFLAQGSKTNERAKKQFNEYIKQLDPDTQVFISTDAFKEMKEIPQFVQDQLDGTGADVSVPLADFLTEIASNEQILEAVRPYVKVQSEFMTRNEMDNNFDSDQAKIMIEQSEKHKQDLTEAEMVYKQVKDQLVGTRRQGEATARHSAELIPAYIVTKKAELAARGIDVSVAELFNDMGFQVIGPNQAPDLQDASSVLEQDEMVDNVPQIAVNQKFGDLTLTDTGTDEAGNTVEVKQKAQQLWNNQLKRTKMVETLRLCVSG